MLLFYQVLICVHDERAGGKLHGASELGKPETQALHLWHAWYGVSVWDQQTRGEMQESGLLGQCLLELWLYSYYVDVCRDE